MLENKILQHSGEEDETTTKTTRQIRINSLIRVLMSVKHLLKQ